MHECVYQLFGKSSFDQDVQDGSDDRTNEDNPPDEFDEKKIVTGLHKITTEILKLIRSEPFRRTHRLLSRDGKKSTARDIATCGVVRWVSHLLSSEVQGYASKLEVFDDDANLQKLVQRKDNDAFGTFSSFPLQVQHFWYGCMSTYVISLTLEEHDSNK